MPLLKHVDLSVSYEHTDSDGPGLNTTDISLGPPWEYLGTSEESPLQSLQLSQCLFNTICVLPGSSKLVSMKLDRCIYVKNDSGDMHGHDLLLRALSASPNLEELSIEWSISSQGRTTKSSFEKYSITLPRLRIVYLKDDIVRALDCLSYLSLTPATKTCIDLDWEESDEETALTKAQEFSINRFMGSSLGHHHAFYAEHVQFEDFSSHKGVKLSLMSSSNLEDERATIFYLRLLPGTHSPPPSPLLAAVTTMLSPRLALVQILAMQLPPEYFDCICYASPWPNVQRMFLEDTATVVALLDAWHTTAKRAFPNVASLLITRADLTPVAVAEKLIHVVVQRQLMSPPCAKLAHVFLDTPLVAQRTQDLIAKILVNESDAEVEAIRAKVKGDVGQPNSQATSGL